MNFDPNLRILSHFHAWGADGGGYCADSMSPEDVALDVVYQSIEVRHHLNITTHRARHRMPERISVQYCYESVFDVLRQLAETYHIIPHMGEIAPDFWQFDVVVIPAEQPGVYLAPPMSIIGEVPEYDLCFLGDKAGHFAQWRKSWVDAAPAWYWQDGPALIDYRPHGIGQELYTYHAGDKVFWRAAFWPGISAWTVYDGRPKAKELADG
jgi:hypothetical protein